MIKSYNRIDKLFYFLGIKNLISPIYDNVDEFF